MTENDSTLTLDIRTFMDIGLDVFDVESKKIGTVDDYDGCTGCMLVRISQLADRFLYVPFNIITHADPREVFVSKTRAEVQRLYRDPPPRTTLVEKRIDPDTGDESLAITTEPSGYDGSPVVVDEAVVGELAHHIAPGFRVYTAEIEDIGSIKQYDPASGRLVVQQGIFTTHELVVPLRLVSSVDRSRRTVYLSAGLKDIERLQKRPE